MEKKRKSNPDTLSKKPFKRQKVAHTDKRHPNPEDPYEGIGPPIKEMPISSNPHREEILD